MSVDIAGELFLEKLTFWHLKKTIRGDFSMLPLCGVEREGLQ